MNPGVAATVVAIPLCWLVLLTVANGRRVDASVLRSFGLLLWMWVGLLALVAWL